MISAVRGAIQIARNDANDILSGVNRLISSVFEQNGIDVPDIVSIQFSQTSDLTARNPATALRTEGYREVPLFCSQEPEYEGSMPRIIRVMVTYNRTGDGKPIPVYLGGARKLRSDLFSTRT